LTAGEPPRSLHSEVRQRIARRRPTWSPIQAWGLAAVALLAVFAAWNMMKADEDEIHGPSAPAIVRSIRPAPPAPAPLAVVSTTHSRVPQRRVAAAVAPAVEEENPLIPPITIEPLSTTRIAVDASAGVTPIEIEPLQIEPLQLTGQ
jgi:hypothetical protein